MPAGYPRPMADGETPASVITIVERDGKKRELELRGPGLPKQGASWEVENRLVTAWYPGNSQEATQQVLGPMLSPSDWEGIWRTTQLIGCPCLWRDGGEQPITRADTLRQRFETLATSGALLRVTWAGAEGRRIVREGRIGPFKASFDRFDDIAWSASFVWVSKGDGAGEASNVTTRTDEGLEASLRVMNDALADLQSAIDDAALRSAFAGLPNSASDFTLGSLENLVRAPVVLLQSYSRAVTQIQTRITQVTAIVQSVEDSPAALAGQMSDTAQEIGVTMHRLFDDFSRQPPELLTHRPERPAAVGSALGYYGRVLSAARRVARAASTVQAKSRRKRSASSGRTGRHDRARPGDAVRIHHPSAADTFAGLALKFYGDAELGHRIAKANNQPAHKLKPGAGRPILIPVLTGQDDAVSPRRSVQLVKSG